MLSIINVVGARPNFMKIAPLHHVMAADPDIKSALVHTGQHYDDNLSTVFFDQLGIPRPDVNLGVGGGSREEQIERIMEAFRPTVAEIKPDLVLVVGDVNSTIACARVAKENNIRVAHVEAGLRSFDWDMPEEHNRVQTDQISDYLFITEPSSIENLTKEGIKGKAFLVGNVMIDSLANNLEKAKRSPTVADLGLTDQGYFTATFHRPSNVDDPKSMAGLVDTLTMVCEKFPLVLPLHPRTANSLEKFGLMEKLRALDNLKLTEPLGYLDFIGLLSSTKAVITDSGGIQEETTYLGVPCLTMRQNTERPVTIDVGTNTLIGSDRKRLGEELDKVLAGTYKKGEIPEMWDGKAASRIVQTLKIEMGT